MLVIGLTGGIASGKSTIARLLAERGATVVDADALGHEIYQPGLPAWKQILEAFGPEIAGAGGVIDRRRLGSLVFGDPVAMKRLTDIVWPEMKNEMRRRLGELGTSGAQIAILEAAVLLEARWEDLVDEVWVVTVPPETAVGRLIERSRISEADARGRLAAQMSSAERVLRANVVIDNSAGIDDLSGRVDALWRGVVRRAA